MGFYYHARRPRLGAAEGRERRVKSAQAFIETEEILFTFRFEFMPIHRGALCWPLDRAS